MAVRKTQILLVDDEVCVRKLLQRILEEAGYGVVSAANGGEALDKLSQGNVSLVLLDIRLPGLNGFEVLRSMRQRLNIPVIMLTGLQEVTDVRDAIDLGADDCVRKPFRTGELLARIEAKLRRCGHERLN